MARAHAPLFPFEVNICLSFHWVFAVQKVFVFDIQWAYFLCASRTIPLCGCLYPLSPRVNCSRGASGARSSTWLSEALHLFPGPLDPFHKMRPNCVIFIFIWSWAAALVRRTSPSLFTCFYLEERKKNKRASRGIIHWQAYLVSASSGWLDSPSYPHGRACQREYGRAQNGDVELWRETQLDRAARRQQLK